MTHEWVDPATRAAVGKAARKRVPRISHASFEALAGRDPIAILDKQEADRLQHLLPLRHQRMAESAFAYYRGTPAVMAFDLAGTPRSDIFVQASGDAHLSNFGLFASPERRLVFDANDFDETMPGPWEWDVKRLAASFVIAGQANGFSQAWIRKAAMESVRSYRAWMARYARMPSASQRRRATCGTRLPIRRARAPIWDLLPGIARTRPGGRIPMAGGDASPRELMRALQSNRTLY